MKIEVPEIRILIDIPAIEKLADVLAGMRFVPGVSTGGDIAMNAPETSPVAPFVEVIGEVIDVTKKPAESKETAKSEDVDQKPKAPAKKKCTIEQIAVASMALRDGDAENYDKILAMFPEFGINSLGDLRGNEEAIEAFAERLRGMGADI